MSGDRAEISENLEGKQNFFKNIVFKNQIKIGILTVESF